MKKKINEDAITNELRSGSLLFRRPTNEFDDEDGPAPELPAPPPVISRTSGDELPQHFGERTSDRPSVRTGGSFPAKRLLKRHPFEFYQDQLEALHQFALEAQVAGGRGNKSEMVREAVDEYIAKRRGTLDRPSVRTETEP
jgi:hypothetical protein